MEEEREPRGGVGPPTRQPASRVSAYELGAARELLANFTDDQLKQIPVLAPGSLVERDEACLDLADPTVVDCTATSGTVVAENVVMVPRSGVGDRLWRKLRGEPSPDEPRPGPRDDATPPPGGEA